MGADVHTHMSTEVTHLVVGETQSKKYIVGKNSNNFCQFQGIFIPENVKFGFESN